MRDEYDIKSLNPRNNSYSKKLNKERITLSLDSKILKYFKEESELTGIPYQKLINICLAQYVEEHCKDRNYLSSSDDE